MTADVVRPTFLIAGAARSGTTALAQILAQHPGIFVTDPKETHFLAHANLDVSYRIAPGDDVTVDRHLITDPDRYYELYARAGAFPARGEGSVSTLYRPERSIPAIRRYADPDVRVIAILREPADRAYSSYLYLRARGFEHCETFEEALALEEEREAAGYHHMWQLRGMSRYHRQVPDFAAAFGERFKVIVFEEYRQDPARHLDELCRFLGVEAGHDFVTDVEINRGGEPRSRHVTWLMDRLRRLTPVRHAVKALTPEPVRERIRRANLRRPAAERATLEQLRSEFAPDVEQVEAVLGRPIPSWRDP